MIGIDDILVVEEDRAALVVVSFGFDGKLLGQCY
jgi:hypothetical protein